MSRKKNKNENIQKPREELWRAEHPPFKIDQLSKKITSNWLSTIQVTSIPIFKTITSLGPPSIDSHLERWPILSKFLHLKMHLKQDFKTSCVSWLSPTLPRPSENSVNTGFFLITESNKLSSELSTGYLMAHLTMRRKNEKKNDK